MVLEQKFEKNSLFLLAVQVVMHSVSQHFPTHPFKSITPSSVVDFFSQLEASLRFWLMQLKLQNHSNQLDFVHFFGAS
jgi:hypothetical protein